MRSFQVNRLEAYRVDELPRPSPAVPVDTIHLHSVIELDRTGNDHKLMSSTPHMSDVNFGTLLIYSTCYLKCCYHGLKICPVTTVMLPQRSHGVTRNNFRCYNQHTSHLTASMQQCCQLNQC